MSKKNKAKAVTEEKMQADSSAPVDAQKQTQNVEKPQSRAASKQDKNAKNAKQAQKKTKKEKKHIIRKKTKETVSELKKVTWPKFPYVVKKTGVVLVVVIIFAVLLLGIDALFGFLFKLITSGQAG